MHTVPTVEGALVKLGPFSSHGNLDLIARAPLGGCGDGLAGMDLLPRGAVLIGHGSATLSCAAAR
jgi:hypothetical protein